MVRGPLKAEDRSGASLSDRRSLPARERKRRREARSYSGVLYEYRVERSRATRGATQCEWLRPALDAGFFILRQCLVAVTSGRSSHREFRNKVAGQLKHQAKSQTKLGQGWKARSRKRGPLSPTRQVLRHSGHSDGLGLKVL